MYLCNPNKSKPDCAKKNRILLLCLNRLSSVLWSGLMFLLFMIDNVILSEEFGQPSERLDSGKHYV